MRWSHVNFDGLDITLATFYINQEYGIFLTFRRKIWQRNPLIHDVDKDGNNGLKLDSTGRI